MTNRTPEGIDVKAERGTIIFAAAEGTAVVSAVELRYGRVVKIEHDDGAFGLGTPPMNAAP